MAIENQIRGCIYGGFLGDAYGSAAEGQASSESFTLDYVDAPRLTDDTQLTLATCEALSINTESIPEQIAESFADWYQRGKVTGMGSSTLKAMRDLSMGAAWYISGARGEMSAGNGAAMRIAPLAFLKIHPDDFRFMIRDVSAITHKNDEAYVGALAVVTMIQNVAQGVSITESLKALPETLPDTRVRDNICEASRIHGHSIEDAAKTLGTSGHVADSIPFALFAAAQIPEKGFIPVIETIIRSGGDTDTNASIAGQIGGTFIGGDQLPETYLSKIEGIEEVDRITESFIRQTLS